ncbi:hypothetical protein BU52_28415 [Streptomyces toyocaensis]|uniref:Uncharacterized protein n=1 Tax=Streptomyces toyocaensis TaxID=55952 RepID=A0A081XJP1_STRTO|nr:hypothetical protein [Streptomyces toyocaensis]KES03764.1 hypothetical protein BU52_28415 [Streptomyces toyocaensis]
MNQVLYGERSRNPLARTVELTEGGLRRGGRTTPLEELNLGAMAEAFLRGRWLGGGGSERALSSLPQDRGAVPVTRATGTSTPVKVRQAAEFARALGELAVRGCGGPDQVAALAARARAEGVPLWIARRYAHGPAGPVTVAVDRRSVRVDVWGPHAPAVRLRAPHGYLADSADRARGLVLTVGDVTARLELRRRVRKSKSKVEIGLPGRQWTLRRGNAVSSWLLRDDTRVALLTRPPRRAAPDPGTVLLPLADVHHESPDPLDAVMAHAVAVSFGLGDTTGTARFRAVGSRRDTDEPIWDAPWFSNLGRGRDDNEPGGGDGWGSDGGDGGDGGGSGGGDGGGGDGGGGGGGGGD